MRLEGRTLQIGPVAFRVTRRGSPKDYGGISLAAQEVYIAPHLKADMQAVTIVHEALHGIMELGQYNDESRNEHLVDCLAVGIVALLRDNAWIKEIIYEGE